ncbi:acyltransferase [Erythrobacter sp.]|uniref:acyltransferase family protein n=1 Tax=Erythrobacter sp. TaxID=1042 RepID=UPI001425C0C1|nr:acyltransferase [Erythrobacter sp.]QIQ86306.1 MAG: acyltransferase [Erythrobacter sp.]
MKGRLAEIDALRGVAALAVAFIYHQHYLTGQFQSGPLDGLPVFSWLHKNGFVAVDLFFVISGFIFAYIYADRKAGEVSGRDFFWARFARLYPLHLATLIVCAFVLWFGNPASGGRVENGAWHFALNLLMLQESGLETGKSFNVASWSISVEIYCYVIFYFLVSRFPERLYQVSGCLAVVGLLMTVGDDLTVDRIGRGLCGFFAGVVMFRYRKADRVPVLFAFLAFALAAMFVPDASRGAKLGFAFFPALVVFSLRMSFLRHPALTWLGDRSYSIYMWHIPIFMGFNILLFGSQPIPEVLVWPVLIAAWLAVLVVSDLSYRMVETPCRVWLRSKLARPALPQPPAVPAGQLPPSPRP